MHIYDFYNYIMLVEFVHAVWVFDGHILYTNIKSLLGCVVVFLF